MFNYELYRAHWMYFSVGTGVIAMVIIVLTYIALWRARPAEKQAQEPIAGAETFRAWFQRVFPWALILILAATWALGIVYPWIAANYPPNW